MPLNAMMNAWMMKGIGEGSSMGANLEYHSGKRTLGDLNAGEGSQVKDPKKTKMESPSAPRDYMGHYNILQSGEKQTSREDFPVEVFEGFKLGEDAKSYDGLTRGEITSRCMKGMGQVISDFVRIVDGVGPGGRDEVNNLWIALQQSEKEKAVLREQLQLTYNMYEAHSVMKLQLEQSEKEKKDLRDSYAVAYSLYETHRRAKLRMEEECARLKVEIKKLEAQNNKLYETHQVQKLRLEEERALLKSELEKLKAREDKRVSIKLEMAKDN